MNNQDRISKDFASLRAGVQRLSRIIPPLMELLMATIDDLQAKIDELETAVRDDQAGDAAIVADLNHTIADLRAQVDANQPIDTQPLIDRLETIKESLQPANGGGTTEPIIP